MDVNIEHILIPFEEFLPKRREFEVGIREEQKRNFRARAADSEPGNFRPRRRHGGGGFPEEIEVVEVVGKGDSQGFRRKN